MLRELLEADIESVVNLENLTLGETLGSNMLKDIITNPIMKAYVYEELNKVLGYISISFDGYTIEILNFCVDESRQRSGIGKALLNYAIMNSYKNGAKNVVLEVRRDNYKAIALYEAFGFKIISTRKKYYKDLCDALVYEKKLNDYLVTDKKIFNLSTKYIKTDDYIKYYDDYQFDKYYNNFYKIFNLDVIDRLIEENKDKPFLCFEYDTPIKREGFDVIDDNIIMASFIKALNIKSNRDVNIIKVDESNKDLVYKFLYEDNLQYGEAFADKDSIRHVENMLNGNAVGFIAMDNDKIIGILNTFYENDICELDYFYVIEEYQRKGIGSAIILHALDYYKKLGCNMAILVADNNDTPKDMYLKWGFVIIEESFFSRRGK